MSRVGGSSSKGKGKERDVVELDDSDEYGWEEQEFGKNGAYQATQEEQDKLEQVCTVYLENLRYVRLTMSCSVARK